MCGRATLTVKPKELEKHFQATFDLSALERAAALLPTYNIAPTHWHPVITNESPDQLQLFKWGLIPSWAKDAKMASRLINARIETIVEKPSFKAIHTRRCLVPLDGFYEWKKEGNKKMPYRMVLKNQGLFSVAGIWEKWSDPARIPLYTFSVLTQAANELMRPIHDRMPVILSPEQEKKWLDMDVPAKDILQFLSPYPSEWMDAYPVNSRVGQVANNNATLIARDFPTQGTLF